MTAAAPKRRNVDPVITSAKCRLAGLIARGAPADKVESARAELRSLNARAAVRELLELPLGERAELATMLLTGGGADAA